MLQIVSDLHLEQGVVPIKPKGAHALAVLGDTAEWVRSKEKWQQFVLNMTKEFETLFVVNGNHEFYCKPLTATKAEIEQEQNEFMKSVPQAVLLNNNEVKWRGLTVAGCTLWSHVPDRHVYDVKNAISDYHRIYVADRTTTMKVKDGNEWHASSVQFLTSVIDRNEPTVVLTHHAPLMKNTSAPKYEEEEDRAANFAFASDLSKLMKPNVKTWCYGHTHWSCDFVYNSTRIVSNAYGYVFEQTRFDPSKIIEIL